jgi:uncharacterized protein (TIGR03435 family)
MLFRCAPERSHMRLFGLLTSACLVVILACGDAFSQTIRATPRFDVVSIRSSGSRKPGERPVGSRVDEKPDGSVTLINLSAAQLIERAYPATVPREILNLPEWARRERYDVRATSSLAAATREDRIAMLRAMLADRFKLAVRFETGRAQPAYNLVVARRDGLLGEGLKPVDLECPADHRAFAYAAREAPQASEAQRPNLKMPPPPCSFRIVAAPMRDRYGDGHGRLGDLLEGASTMAMLADLLRWSAARIIFDRTGLKGTYRVTLNFDNRYGLQSLIKYPKAPGPSVLRAIEEQLGLKLQSSGVLGEVLIIDRLARPLENVIKER